MIRRANLLLLVSWVFLQWTPVVLANVEDPIEEPVVDQSVYQLGSYSDYLVQTGNIVEAKSIRPPNFLSIDEINQLRPAKGTYETEGYVAKIYICPPCPKEGLCQPCPRNYIVISEEPTEFDFASLMDKQMLLFIDDGFNLEQGKRYTYLIKALDVKTTEQPINNFQLIYFEKSD